MRILILVSLTGVLASGCYSLSTPASEVPAENNPCVDAQYLVLSERNLGEMTDREYAYYVEMGRACMEHHRLAAQREAEQQRLESLRSMARSLSIIAATTATGAIVLGAYLISGQ